MHLNVYFLSALAGIAVIVWEIAKAIRNRQNESLKDTVLHAIQDLKESTIDPLIIEVAVMKDRVNTMWGTDAWWRKSAYDAATILHHPEPSRFRVDALLDVFKTGTITKAEIDELKRNLQIIVTYEEGHPSPFKVFPGEQVAASILLNTIDHITQGEDA